MSSALHSIDLLLSPTISRGPLRLKYIICSSQAFISTHLLEGANEQRIKQLVFSRRYWRQRAEKLPTRLKLIRMSMLILTRKIRLNILAAIAYRRQRVKLLEAMNLMQRPPILQQQIGTTNPTGKPWWQSIPTRHPCTRYRR